MNQNLKVFGVIKVLIKDLKKNKVKQDVNRKGRWKNQLS